MTEAALKALKAKRETGLCKKLNPIDKAKLKPKSLRYAINARCWQCQGEDADPGVRWRTGNCEIPSCALYPHRPYQRLVGTRPPKALSFLIDEDGYIDGPDAANDGDQS